MLKKFDCKCGRGHIAIDTDDITFTCGIVGIVQIKDVQIFGGKAECAICKTVFYDQKQKEKV